VVIEPVIADVQEFRRAARMIAEAKNRTHGDKLAAFIRLGQLVREKAEAPELAQGAVWAELQRFLYGEPPEPSGPDPVERACRGLLREGYARCPSCRRPLPGEEEFSVWEQRRQAILERHQAFEGAAGT
jgi:hypothetical protein